MPTAQEIIQDPKFQGLPELEKHKVLLKHVPDYAALSDDENITGPSENQLKALSGMRQYIKPPAGFEGIPGFPGARPVIPQGASSRFAGSTLMKPEERALLEAQQQREIELQQFSEENPTKANVARFGRLGLETASSVPYTPGLGGIVKGGLRFVGAKQLSDLLEESLGTPEGQRLLARKPAQAGKELATDIASSVILEGTGRGVARAAGLRAPLTKEQIEAQLLARQKNIPLTAADVTQSMPVAQYEQFLGNVPFSSGIIQDQRLAQSKALRTESKKLLDSLGVKMEPSELGGLIQEKAGAGRKAFREEADALFSAVDTAIPTGTAVPFTNLQTVAKEELDLLKKLPPGIDKTKLENTLLGLSGLDSKTASILSQVPVAQHGSVLSQLTPKSDWAGAQRLRSELRQLAERADPHKTGNVEGALYLRMKNALDKDMQDLAQSLPGDVQDAYNAANAYYASGAEIFKDRKILSILNSKPEVAAGIIIKPNAVTDIKKLKLAMGEENFNPVKRAFLEKIMNQQAEETFSPQKFLTSLRKFEPETLREVFTPAELNGIEELAKISKFSRGAERVASNVSGTGQAMISGESIKNIIGLGQGGLIFNDLATGVPVVLTPPILAKFYLSPIGRKLLIDGFRNTPQGQKGRTIASKIALIAATDGRLLDYRDQPKTEDELNSALQSSIEDQP